MCPYPAFNVSCFILIARQIRVVVTYVCTWLFLGRSFPCVMSFYLWQSKRGGAFNICLYPALPVSRLSICLVYVSQRHKKGGVLTHVRAWLSICHVYLTQGEKGGFNIRSAPGFPCIMSAYLSPSTEGWFQHRSVTGFPAVMCFYVSHSEKGVSFNMCLYVAFPVSCRSTCHKVNRRRL